MNIINVNIDFEQGICRNEGISVVTGDYASTKVVFEFNESATGTKIFEMKNPSDELVYADEIVDNEIILTGQKDVVDTNGYIKYLDDNQNVYWYDSTNDVIYNSNYEEATGVELDTLTKQTEIATLFTEEGDYTFEVSLYQDNSKLTSVCGYITANQEQVIVDGEEIQAQITLFDNLMNDLSTKIEEVNNLDIDAEKVEHTTTITLTKKDNTQKTVDILDGEKGDKGDKGDAGAIKFEIVQELPTTGIKEDTIYLVPIQEPVTGNNYDEWLYVNGNWEKLGSVSVEIDLNNYYTKSETNALIPTKTSQLTNDSGFMNSLFIAKYGETSYTDVKSAIQNGKIVFCEVQGTQSSKRYAFLAYHDGSINNIEFQYYRSNSNHNLTNRDSVFIYKITNNNTWTTNERVTELNYKAGTGITLGNPDSNTTSSISVDTSVIATREWVESLINSL